MTLANEASCGKKQMYETVKSGRGDVEALKRGTLLTWIPRSCDLAGAYDATMVCRVGIQSLMRTLESAGVEPYRVRHNVEARALPINQLACLFIPFVGYGKGT